MSLSRRFVPSLQELRVLDAVARHKSISAAARELHVSQPTVSYHIKQLEEKWATKLFRSKGRGLEQTELTQDILSEVTAINQSIENLSYMLASQTVQKPLAVGIAPSLASILLVPRLERFYEAFPSVSLRISATNRYVKFSEENIDLALRLLPKPEGELTPSLLLPKPNERMRVVCSPAYFKALTGEEWQSGADCADITLLEHGELIHEDEAFHWQKYLASVSPDHAGGMEQRLSFNNADLILQTALSGRGFALLRDLYVRDALDSGALIEPFSHTLPTQRAFQFVLPENSMPSQAAWHFIGWLSEEISRM